MLDWIYFDYWKRKTIVSIAKVLLFNGALLKLDNELSKQNLSWSEFSFVVSNSLTYLCASGTVNVFKVSISAMNAV